MKIPDRRLVDQQLVKNSEELRMVMHPAGTYLGVINKYREKKSHKWAVEIYDLHH